MGFKDWWYRTKSWWTKDDVTHLPDKFGKITPKDLKLGDILIYYYGNKVTQAHGQWMRSVKYGRMNPSPYHANIVYGRIEECSTTIIMDTELTNSLSILETEYMSKSALRIDVIRYKDLSAEQFKQIENYIEKEAAEENIYGVRRFGSFASQIPGFGWVDKVPLIKPSKSEMVCSGRVAEAHIKTGFPVSSLPVNQTAPVDIVLYALKTERPVELYTLQERTQD